MAVGKHYVVEDDNSCSVMGGTRQGPVHGAVATHVKTFPYYGESSRSAADALDAAYKLRDELNAKAVETP